MTHLISQRASGDLTKSPYQSDGRKSYHRNSYEKKKHGFVPSDLKPTHWIYWIIHFQMDSNIHISLGWPTPLKNDGLRQLGWWNSQLNGKRIHSCSKPPASNSYHKYTHFPSGFQDIFPLTYHALVRFSSKRRGCWWPARTWQRSPSPSASPNPTPTRSPRWSYLGLAGGYSTMAKQR